MDAQYGYRVQVVPQKGGIEHAVIQQLFQFVAKNLIPRQHLQVDQYCPYTLSAVVNFPYQLHVKNILLLQNFIILSACKNFGVIFKHVTVWPDEVQMRLGNDFFSVPSSEKYVPFNQ